MSGAGERCAEPALVREYADLIEGPRDYLLRRCRAQGVSSDCADLRTLSTRALVLSLLRSIYGERATEGL